MQSTKIEWATHSSNPIMAFNIHTNKRGHYCTKVSRGCSNCYAERINLEWGNKLEYTAQNAKNIRFELNHDELKKIRDFKKPARVFLCDMTDFAHDLIPDTMIIKLIATLIQARPWVHSLLLTKRIQRIAKLFTDPKFIQAIFTEIYGELPPATTQELFGTPSSQTVIRLGLDSQSPGAMFQWPPQNIHIGTSIEDQKTLWQRGHYLAHLTRAGWTTYYSLEPMIGPVDYENVKLPPVGPEVTTLDLPRAPYFTNYLRGTDDTPLVHGIILGGESGQGAVPLHPELPRTIRDTCIKHRIPYFFKQWGHWLPVENTKTPAWQHGGPPRDWPWNEIDPRIEKDPTEPWRYFALGKTQTGNTLDQRQHLYIPNRDCKNITQQEWLQTAKEHAA
ncbi:MAG: DUF5131 family protein [Candidatus Hydrogenedentes bacterium]|nr:DUF5131 family protein [Candidatus Hydrogenedentota bacterium]